VPLPSLTGKQAKVYFVFFLFVAMKLLVLTAALCSGK
jgi:hypothetical protein